MRRRNMEMKIRDQEVRLGNRRKEDREERRRRRVKNRSHRHEKSSQERQKGKDRSGTKRRKEEPVEEKAEKVRGYGHRACKRTLGDAWSFTVAQISLPGTSSCLPQSDTLCGKPARELLHFLLWAGRDTQDATKLHLALPHQGSPALQ